MEMLAGRKACDTPLSFDKETVRTLGLKDLEKSLARYPKALNPFLLWGQHARTRRSSFVIVMSLQLHTRPQNGLLMLEALHFRLHGLETGLFGSEISFAWFWSLRSRHGFAWIGNCGFRH